MGCSILPILFTTAFEVILIGAKRMVCGVNLEEHLSWAGMKIKPAKSQSQSIRKEAQNDHISFSFDGENILLLLEQPVRSLGRLYSTDLLDKHMVDSVMAQFSEGLVKTGQSQLPRKFKAWCHQFTLMRPDVVPEVV